MVIAAHRRHLRAHHILTTSQTDHVALHFGGEVSTAAED